MECACCDECSEEERSRVERRGDVKWRMRSGSSEAWKSSHLLVVGSIITITVKKRARGKKRVAEKRMKDV